MSPLRMLSDRSLTCVNDSRNYTVELANRHLHSMVIVQRVYVFKSWRRYYPFPRASPKCLRQPQRHMTPGPCAIVMMQVKFKTQSYKNMQLKKVIFSVTEVQYRKKKIFCKLSITRVHAEHALSRLNCVFRSYSAILGRYVIDFWFIVVQGNAQVRIK